MTDRELLEMAAKVAGYQIDGPASKYMVQGYTFESLLRINESGGHSVWNPLNDDGDAFRLMVLLNIYPVPSVNASKNDGAVSVYYPVDSYGQEQSIREHIDGDHLAATRRVIVRAAAEIGKTK